MLSAKTYLIFATSFLAFFSVDYADATTDEEYLMPFLGKIYQLDSSGSTRDDVLRSLQLSATDITKAKAAKPIITLTFDNGQYTLKRSNGWVGDFTHKFKIGEAFPCKFLDKNVKVTFTQQRDVLKQVANLDNNKSCATCIYSFTPDKLTVFCIVAQIGYTQTYVLKK